MGGVLEEGKGLEQYVLILKRFLGGMRKRGGRGAQAVTDPQNYPPSFPSPHPSPSFSASLLRLPSALAVGGWVGGWGVEAVFKV